MKKKMVIEIPTLLLLCSYMILIKFNVRGFILQHSYSKLKIRLHSSQ